ncbi:MAG: peptide chain release factor-like protein [Fibrobacterota bacterium]
MGPNKEKEAALEARMLRFGVRMADIDEQFTRSQGNGGQNVNKTSTCVQFLHRPTGLIVKCSDTRSQLLNRFLGLRRLVDKIEAQILGRRSEAQQHIEKIRRQKRKRSKRAKAKMLDDKRHHSEKKQQRGSSGFSGD